MIIRCQRSRSNNGGRGDEPISATTHERGGRLASIKNFTCLEEFPDGPRDARHTPGKHRYRLVPAVIPTIAYCFVRVAYSVLLPVFYEFTFC